MKQKLRVFLTLLLCAVASVGWGQTTITYNFDTKSWTAKIDGTVPAESADWTSGKDGNAFTKGQGIQITTSASGANATSPISFDNVSKISVEYCTNATNGVGTIAVKVGGGNAKSFSVTKPSSGGTTLKTAEFIFDPNETGKVNISVTCTTNSIYIHSITIIYGSGGTTTPSLSINPASIAFGEKAINDSYNETFDVNFANLTENLTVSVGSGLTGVSVSPTTISKEATSPQTVTVTYAPTLAGDISGNITVSNNIDGVSQTVTVSGTAYDPSDASTYLLYTDAIVEGDYVIYNTNGAMKNEVSSNRFVNQSVTPENNQIINPENTIVWHIAKNGDYWTIYNAAIGKYAAGTSIKNQGALVDEVTNLAKWTITVSDGTWSFENYGRSEGSDPGNKYLRQNSTSGWACYGSGTGQSPMLYKFDDGTPSISADDVNIAYDAEDGSIEYTIVNPVEGTTLNALTTAIWLTLGEVGESSIPFTCSANETTEPRTAIVTLTYGEVTEDVTVTQAAAPVTYTTIPAIFDAATAAGSTGTNVNVTFGDWVVSGVSGSNVYVTDNNGNGFIIYKSDHGFTVNNKLSGTVFETPLKLYNGSAEFTNLTNSTTGLEVANDGSITVITDKTIADLGGVNTGAVITLSNLTYDGTVLSDGTNTIKPYNSLYSEMSFTSGKTYNVTGVYLNYGSTKEILPRSDADIEEVETPIQTTISAGTLSHVAIANLYDGNMEDITLGENVAEGTEVFFTLSVDDGYTLESVRVLNADNEEVTLTENQGSWSFTMPNSSVTINATATAPAVEKTLSNANIVAAGDGDQGYKNWTITDNNGKEWNAFAIKNQHSNATSAYHFLQIKKYASNTAYYLQVPEYGTKITKIEMTVSSSSQPMTGGGNTATLYFSAENSTSAAGEGVSSGTGASTVTIDCSGLNLNTGYITASGSVRIWDVTVTYEEATSETVTVSVNDKATDGNKFYSTLYYGQKNLKIPAGITASGVSLNGTKLVKGAALAEGDVIGKGNAVLLTADEAKGYEFTVVADTEVDATISWDDNMLRGNDEYAQTTGGGVYYQLSRNATQDANSIGFYWGAANGGAFNNKAHRAYLVVPAEQAKGITGFTFGDMTDGIEAINNSQSTTDKVYNLSGQRVNKTQKGIYIVNGKKVVVK